MSKRAGLIATKVGNSTYFDGSGKSLPVTILKIDDCIVTAVMSKEKNGYISLQLASIDRNKDIKKIKKPQQKMFASLKTKS